MDAGTKTRQITSSGDQSDRGPADVPLGEWWYYNEKNYEWIHGGKYEFAAWVAFSLQIVSSLKICFASCPSFQILILFVFSGLSTWNGRPRGGPGQDQAGEDLIQTPSAENNEGSFPSEPKPRFTRTENVVAKDWS